MTAPAVTRAALGAGLALAAVAALRVQSGGRGHPALRHTGRSARALRLARTGVRLAVLRARHRDEELVERSAAEIAQALGGMKGALMKLGQMASYLDEGLPAPVREAMAQLQQDAPPMDPELAAAVIRTELGSPPQRLFAEWDPTPLAAASIGQVHRARLHDGREVAVKVQYPGIDEAVRSDLDTTDVVARALRLVFPGLQPGPLVAELRARLGEELDYRVEADNQQLFADAYAGHPFIHVPSVVRELSTGRVLTSELATGVRFAEVAAWSQEERDLAGESIFRFVFRSLYRLHAFNGDPHPGNYLFRPGGRVTFLDFGLVRRFDAADQALFERLIRTMLLDPDPASFRRTLEDGDLLAPGAPFADDEVADFFAHFYEVVRADGPTALTPEYASETVRKTFDARANEILRYANVPPSFVLLQRINLGLFAVLASLRACANYRRVAEELWPWTDAPPSTPLGEAEAAWLAQRGKRAERGEGAGRS